MRQVDAQYVSTLLPDLHRHFARLKINAHRRFDAEVQELLARIADPGPWGALTHGDPCPHNLLVIDPQPVLIDFEWGGYRHALTDAVYARMLFPTCYGIYRLPPSILDTIERAYRALLCTVCAPAADDTCYHIAVVDGCAFWALKTLGWYLERALTETDEWTDTLRMWVLARTEAFLTTAARGDACTALQDTLHRLVVALRQEWPQIEREVPVFPALCQGQP